VDQGRTLRGRQCIQGLVTLTDVSEETGGFCCIPRSHSFHDDLVGAHATSDDNYRKVPSDFPCLQDTQVLPRCRAGDLILWDSRTIHCSSPALRTPSAPPDRLLRMASYICMVPADMATAETLSKRREMYQCNVTGTHWPHILNFKRNPNDKIVNDLNSLSPEAAALLLGRTLAVSSHQGHIC
jgi:ectoine hydroxylase-related dioxygenase (phytanoyl-CoA dioxygenase family)